MPGGNVEYNSEPFQDSVVFMRPAEVDADVRKMASNFFDTEVLDWLAAMLGRPVSELKFDSSEAVILGRTTDVGTLSQLKIAQFYDFVFTIDDCIHRLRALYRMVTQSNKFPSVHVQRMLDANVIGSGFVPHHLTEACRDRAKPRCRFGNAAWKDYSGASAFQVYNTVGQLNHAVQTDGEVVERDLDNVHDALLAAAGAAAAAVGDVPEAAAQIDGGDPASIDRISPFTLPEAMWNSSDVDMRRLKWNQMVASQEAALLNYPLLDTILALNQGLFRVYLTRAQHNLMPGSVGSVTMIPKGMWVNAFAAGEPPINIMPARNGLDMDGIVHKWMETYLKRDGGDPDDFAEVEVKLEHDIVRGVLQPKIKQPDMYVLMGDPMAYPSDVRRSVASELAPKLPGNNAGVSVRLAVHAHLTGIHKHDGRGGAIGSVILNGTTATGLAPVAADVQVANDARVGIARRLNDFAHRAADRIGVGGFNPDDNDGPQPWLMDEAMDPTAASSISRAAVVQHVPWGVVHAAMLRLGAQGHPIGASPRLREVFDMSNIGRLLLVFYNRISAAYTKERETSMVGQSITSMDDLAGLRSKAAIGYEMACPDGMAPRFVEMRGNQRVPLRLDQATFLHSDGKRYMKPGAVRDGCEPLRPAPLLSGGLRPNVLLSPLVGPGGTSIMGGADPATRNLLKQQAGDGSIVPDIYSAKDDAAADELGANLFASGTKSSSAANPAAAAADLLMGA